MSKDKPCMHTSVTKIDENKSLCNNCGKVGEWKKGGSAWVRTWNDEDN